MVRHVMLSISMRIRLGLTNEGGGRCLVRGRLGLEAPSARLCLVDGARRGYRSNLGQAIRVFRQVCSNVPQVHLESYSIY
jgi:hypothetical protein